MDMLYKYINFKKQNIVQYLSIIMNKESFDSFELFVIESFNNIFVQSYYYGIYETIEKSDEYTINQILERELYGKRLELLKDVDDSEILEEYDVYMKKIRAINKIYSKIKIVFKIEISDLSNNLEDTIKNIISINNIDFLIKKIKSNLKKEEKFLNSIKPSDFSLKYLPFRNHSHNKYINMTYSIKKLNRNYKSNTVDRVYYSSSLEISRIMTMMRLLNVELLIKVINRDKLDNYFIQISELFLQNKNSFTELLKYLDNIYLNKHVVILIPDKVYKRHKAYFKRFESKYRFALLIDLSYIKDVSTKLDTLEENKLFDFIVVDKVKNDDYQAVINYDSLTKEIMMMEFDD